MVTLRPEIVPAKPIGRADDTSEPDNIETLRGDLDSVKAQLRERGWKAFGLNRIDIRYRFADNPYQTDKVAQKYMPVYEELARELGPAAKICELGVWQGGSLSTWQVFFPDGLVAGVDCGQIACWPQNTIEIRLPQEDPRVADVLRSHSPSWDIIVDDCSHEGTLSVESFNNLWPLVRQGGYYVIEDWFYGWHEGQINSKYNMVHLARDFLEYLRGHEPYDIEEIRYRYGMIVIRKGQGDWRPQVIHELAVLHEDANTLRPRSPSLSNT